MVEIEDRIGRVRAPMTMLSAASLERAGTDALARGVTTFDLAGVPATDSGALAIIFSWIRYAGGNGVALRFANVPAEVASLAAVYDVAEVLTEHLATPAS